MAYEYQKSWFDVDLDSNPVGITASKKASSTAATGVASDAGKAGSAKSTTKTKSGTSLEQQAVVAALGGITAGMAVGSSREEDPFYVQKATGLEQTSLSSNLARERMEMRQDKGKANDADYVFTDIVTGIGGGAVNGYASTGSPWGAILGAATGGITSAITGDQERAKWRKKINEEERLAKQEWRESEARLAATGAVSGAYSEEYTPLSQMLIDQEKKKLDDKLRKSREAAGMKELKTNYYTS